MFEKRKEYLYKGYDTLGHDLLIIGKLQHMDLKTSNSKFKLHAYCKSSTYIQLFEEKKCRPKINSFYSHWEDQLLGAPQVSVLGYLLFNIYICSLFL